MKGNDENNIIPLFNSKKQLSTRNNQKIDKLVIVVNIKMFRYRSFVSLLNNFTRQRNFFKICNLNYCSKMIKWLSICC